MHLGFTLFVSQLSSNDPHPEVPSAPSWAPGCCGEAMAGHVGFCPQRRSCLCSSRTPWLARLCALGLLLRCPSRSCLQAGLDPGVQQRAAWYRKPLSLKVPPPLCHINFICSFSSFCGLPAVPGMPPPAAAAFLSLPPWSPGILTLSLRMSTVQSGHDRCFPAGSPLAFSPGVERSRPDGACRGQEQLAAGKRGGEKRRESGE